MPLPEVPEVPYGEPRLHAYRTRGRTVLELAGEVDLAWTLALGPRLDRLTAQPEPLLVADLTPVTFFDCSGLRMLHRAHRRVSAHHGDLRLVCPHPLTRRLLAVAGAPRLPTACTTLAEALEGPRSDPVTGPAPPRTGG